MALVTVLRAFTRLAIAGAIALASRAPVSASAEEVPAVFTPAIVIAKAETMPKIDGDLSDPAWKAATPVRLGYNLRSHAAAGETTTAYVLTDGTFLYVGFDAKQAGAVHAAQHTNDVGSGTDDQVSVYLWPDGAQGFGYAFSANPIGTHYQSSTENTAYAPTWWSAGRIVPGGYTVTMKVPLSIVRGGGDAWRVQFARQRPDTLDDFVWAFGKAEQQGADQDVRFSGYLNGMPVRRAATRPQPRVQLYGLGAVGAKSTGGSTSRGGADLAIPITPTASFIATIHPDYSNVELDQQTIAPTAYARFYNEVRPFFTQGASFYNDVMCIACPGTQELYTPAIPTPRDGYAIEGTHGPFSFAAFDAVGDRRNDTAQAFEARTPDLKYKLTVNRIAVDMPGLKDDTILYGATHDSNRGLLEYVTYGAESGTLVSDPRQATRTDAGIGVYDKSAMLGFSVRRAGAQYAPYDGYVQHPGIAGWSGLASKSWYLDPKGGIPVVSFSGTIDAYHDPVSGLPNQRDVQASLGWDMQRVLGTTKLWHASVSTGSSYLRLPDGVFAPITQNGAQLQYDARSQTQSAIAYATGRFGAGRLDSWTRLSNVKLGTRGLLTLEADDTVDRLDAGSRKVQWLERASYAYQSGTNASLALGVRRIVGAGPELYGPVPFESGWNLSVAYHARLPHDELYVVYGDASAFSTVPQLVVKVIHYIGAGKGS
jgi:hypothetical protein